MCRIVLQEKGQPSFTAAAETAERARRWLYGDYLRARLRQLRELLVEVAPHHATPLLLERSVAEAAAAQALALGASPAREGTQEKPEGTLGPGPEARSYVSMFGEGVEEREKRTPDAVAEHVLLKANRATAEGAPGPGSLEDLEVVGRSVVPPSTLDKSSDQCATLLTNTRTCNALYLMLTSIPYLSLLLDSTRP